MAPNSWSSFQNAPPVRYRPLLAISVVPPNGRGLWSVASMMPG